MFNKQISTPCKKKCVENEDEPKTEPRIHFVQRVICLAHAKQSAKKTVTDAAADDAADELSKYNFSRSMFICTA